MWTTTLDTSTTPGFSGLKITETDVQIFVDFQNTLSMSYGGGIARENDRGIYYARSITAERQVGRWNR